MVQNTLKKLLAVAIIFCYSTLSFAQNKYQAPKAATAPTIDGFGTDACWTSAPWYTVDQLWALAQPSSTADFSERFKVSWDANKLYVLAEVTDDALNDAHTSPLDLYYEDDTWEVFIDENHSGGDHEKSYNAFAYHISKYYDAVDIGTDGSPHLYNSNLTVKRTANGNVYTWEAAFDIYTDQFVYGAASNPKVTLTKGKIMGFALAYCDNDGGPSRESFIGSEVINAVDKNIAYKDANVFGALELVDAITPTFSHVAIASGMANPAAMTIAPDGRIFVCEQEGKLRVIKNGQLLSTPALTLNVNLGNEFYSERGLLGVTVDPDFATNKYIYVFYTTSNQGKFIADGAHNKVSRFTMNGDVAFNELTLLELDPLSTAINHNGGALHFGKDGKLYIATGENFNQANAQNLEVTHGKILRINADGSIPEDNPFYTVSASKTRKMIWAYGLRNPFTFDFQPGTGKFFVNDVGQDTWEEINDVTVGGKNFGWPATEGITTDPAYTGPLYTYKHSETPTDTTGCSITGGVFFNPAKTNYPGRFLGKYFFADFCNNWIAVMDPKTGKRQEIFAKNVPGAPVAVDIHPDGNIYYLSRTNGAVYKITYSGSPAPDIIDQPDQLTVAESQPAVFKIQFTGANPMTIQWKKNGQPIDGANSDTYTINKTTPSDSGNYTVVLTNDYGTITSDVAKLILTPFNSQPTATIISPATNSKYKGGQTFTLTGTGTDTQDGDLPASAFTWRVDLHHDNHIHDGMANNGTKSFELTIANTGETATNVWYRVWLFVKDSGGLTDTSFIDLLPTIVSLTYNTVPEGLSVTIDGQPVKTPVTIPSVAGVQRNIGVVNPQSFGTKGWRFLSWSNGAAEIHSLTPDESASYTANFELAPITKDAISPEQDAYVTSGTSFAPDGPVTTFGTTDSVTLVVKRYTEGPDRETYFSFDLSKLTGKISNINSAKLKYFASMTDEDLTNKSVTFSVFESKATSWNEKNITWNTKPGNNLIPLGANTISAFSGAFYLVDITDYIKTKANSENKLASIVLAASSNSKNRVMINSSENSLNKPELVVEYDITTSIFANLSESEVYNIYPNPASKTTTITLSGESTSAGIIEITDQTSAVKFTEAVEISNGLNTYEINLNDFKPGMYFMNIISGSEKLTRKLVVE